MSILFPRESGILLHPTSLPGPFGVGDLGDDAYRFIDFLAGAGQHLWQMLPLGPLAYGNSPYQCLSAFGGNPLLISPSRLVQANLLENSDLENVPDFDPNRVDYEAASAFKSRILGRSFEIFESRADSGTTQRFDLFCSDNASWLDDFALFIAVREAHGYATCNAWEEGIMQRRTEAMNEWRGKLGARIKRCKYEQFLFFQQWSDLKSYCAERKVRLIGDIPIFISLDSASVWAHPEEFYLNECGAPTVVAGVPPDYFSKTGQLWNNPLYRWDVMARNGYKWWIDRFRATLSFVDIIRIDHFRGFAKYWEIPAGSKDAVNGRWADGPGKALFDKVKDDLGELPIIAEDLGTITPDVIELRESLGFPGMRVLQFAFISGDPKDLNLPYNYPSNTVAYTGTHDNNTTVGWFHGGRATTLSEETRRRERQRVVKYTGTDGKDIHWDLIRLALSSVANTAIIPLQDVLGLGGEARMNTPGTVGSNWSWRFTSEMLTEEARDKLAEITSIYGRG